MTLTNFFSEILDNNGDFNMELKPCLDDKALSIKKFLISKKWNEVIVVLEEEE